MKHTRVLHLVVVAVAAMCLLIGCGLQQKLQDEPVKGSYYIALTAFNDAVESYLAQRPILSQNVQQDVEPLIYEADKALEVWGVAVHLEDGSSVEKELAYNKVKTELFRLLFKYEILKLQ